MFRRPPLRGAFCYGRSAGTRIEMGRRRAFRGPPPRRYRRRKRRGTQHRHAQQRLLRHADGDLQTHGVLLRRREGDDDTGWQLKVPDAEGRVEIRTGLSDTPPAELTDALTGMRLGKPLVNVATIRTTRDRYRITDPRRHRLCAEVADDHVRASIDDRLLAWREIEVELGPAARSVPHRLTKRLIEAPNPAAIRPSSPESRARRDPKPRAEPPRAGPWRDT